MNGVAEELSMRVSREQTEDNAGEANAGKIKGRSVICDCKLMLLPNNETKFFSFQSVSSSAL
jgi:hypothetical protein